LKITAAVLLLPLMEAGLQGRHGVPTRRERDDGRFKAAVSGASIGNARAGYGTHMYVREYEAELGVPWKNLGVPLLNSEQMYQAVRSVGVETQLIIYPGQFHGLTVPSYLRDRLQRQIDWYRRHLALPRKPSSVSPVRPANASTVARPPAS
jgi:hypothetical protein